MIDLEALTEGRVQNLSGRLRGLAARELFRLDELDASGEVVEVHIPDYVYSLTPSFFQGLFGDSIHAAGDTADAFKRRFRFRAADIVIEQIDRGLSAALTTRDLGSVR